MNLKERFIKSSKEVAIELNLDENNVKFDFHETPNIGIDYTAELRKDFVGFYYHVRIIAENEDPFNGAMDASLDISFDKITYPFNFFEKIDYIKSHPSFLSRWCSWAISHFNNKHKKLNLEAVFSDKPIFVYGLPKQGKRCVEEATYLVNGIIATEQKMVVIYKIRHISSSVLYRSFSYAIYVDNPTALFDFWVFFPDATGIDSGGAYRHYQKFEELISLLKVKCEVVEHLYDRKYQELANFLNKHSFSFHSIPDKKSLARIDDYSMPSTLLKGSKESFNDFIRSYEELNYPATLRNLRALVQQTLENLLLYSSIDFSHLSKPNINKLASMLILNKIIDGRLLPWFNAFTSIASISAHRDFPTKEDMKSSLLKNRILLTIHIGVQLLGELEDITSEKPEVHDIKF